MTPTSFASWLARLVVISPFQRLHFSLSSSAHRPALHSFPTRRSSDLGFWRARRRWLTRTRLAALYPVVRDRKSTRLNSSHTVISYAVFCLKNKKQHYRRWGHTGHDGKAFYHHVPTAPRSDPRHPVTRA